jgi:hypothetical protein
MAKENSVSNNSFLHFNHSFNLQQLKRVFSIISSTVLPYVKETKYLYLLPRIQGTDLTKNDNTYESHATTVLLWEFITQQCSFNPLNSGGLKVT